MEVEAIYSEDNRQRPASSNPIDTDSTEEQITLAAAERFCRRLAGSHYENFIVASLFLPRAMRQPFYNVYAYCRAADDLADHSSTPAIATEKLLDWRRQLTNCFAGDASQPIFVALNDTVSRFQLTIEPFDDLLTAFLQDQTQVRYQSFDDLLGYCRNSANPVGQIVLQLAHADSDENLHLSDSICTGLQLANHWQDVARDFQAGRVYLPLEDAKHFDVNLDLLADSEQRQRFCEMIRFQCDRAKVFLADGLPLAKRVPRWLANDIRLFVYGGLSTLTAIEKVDYDVLKIRPQVSRWTQLRLLGLAATGRLD